MIIRLNCIGPAFIAVFVMVLMFVGADYIALYADSTTKPASNSDEGVTPTAALRTAASSKLTEAKRLADKKRYADGFRKALDAWQTANGWRPSARNAEDRRLMADAITVMKSCSKNLSKRYVSDKKALVLEY